MEYDVFISYHTKSSLDVTKSICNELENRKIKCWYAPRDTFNAYANNIIDVINKCKVFLLILNSESSNSFDVLNEINAVCERLRKNEMVHVIPFQISDGEVSKDARYYIGRFHWIDAITPPLERRIKELADRIDYILNNNMDTSESNKIDYNYSIKNKLRSTAICNITGFIGRKKELEKIEENLENYGKVFLYGMGGIGKSELAKRYAKLNSNKYDTIIFAVYENDLKSMILNDKFFYIENFKRKVNEDGIEESNDDFFIRKLEEIKKISDEKTLIIIDNFNTENKEELKLLLDGNYHLIFTTRNDFSYSKLPVITINQMEDKDELFAIFKENYSLNIQDENKEIIYKIIDELKGHTLAIAIVASVMNLTRISPKNMLDKIKNGITPDLKGEVQYNFRDFDSVYNCIEFVFDLSNLTDIEKDILMKLYFFPVSGVNFEEFMDLSNLDSGEYINKLIRKSLVLYDHILDSISLHPLISSVIKNELKPDIKAVKPIMSKLADGYSWYLLLKDKEKYTPLIVSIYNKLPDISINEASDYARLSFYLRDVNEFKLAEEIILKVLDVAIKAEVGKEELGNLYKEIEYLYYKKNDDEKSKEYILKIIEIGRSLGKESRLLIEGLNKLAYKYVDDEEPNMALPYINEAYEIIKKAKDIPSNIYASCELCYSKIYYQLSDFDKALKYATSYYDKVSNGGKEENQSVSSALKIMGEIYLKQGDLEKAILNFEKCIDIRKKYCSKEDFSLLKCEELLAISYVKNLDYKKAYDIFKEIDIILKTGQFNCDKLKSSVANNLKICSENLN